MRQLVFVHGRSHQGMINANLKGQWLQALQDGFDAATPRLQLDIDPDTVRFPFFGDTLDALTYGTGNDPDVVILGGDPAAAEKAFLSEAVMDAVETHGIDAQDIRAELPEGQVVELGPQNWPWVLAAVRALEKIEGFGSFTLSLVTRDVHAYLNRTGVQTRIETGVRQAFDGLEECVVVGHSLGSVVAYNLLARQSPADGWKVPSLITVGSPLAVRPVREALAPLSRPSGTSEWFNAYDPRDIVALHPLDSQHFPVTPGIDNYAGVDNKTSNRHGIKGYLSDPVVARRIHDALLP